MTSFPIRITSAAGSIVDVPCDWLVVGTTQDGAMDSAIAELDARSGGELTRLREAGDLTGKHLEIVTILSPRGIGARRLLLVGQGAIDKRTRSVVHDAFAAALRGITGRKFGRVALALPSPA